MRVKHSHYDFKSIREDVGEKTREEDRPTAVPLEPSVDTFYRLRSQTWKLVETPRLESTGVKWRTEDGILWMKPILYSSFKNDQFVILNPHRNNVVVITHL